MKHEPYCDIAKAKKNRPDLLMVTDCTCTPIESPEEKCECKDTCEEEKGGWGKKLVEKLPTQCFVGLSENEAETTMALVDNFLRSELATAREEERTEMLRRVEESIQTVEQNFTLDEQEAQGMEQAIQYGFDKALTAVKEILSAEIKK